MKHLSTLLMLLFCSSYLAHATDPCIGFGAGFTFDIDDATQTTTFINQATGNYGNNIQWSFYDNGNYTYSSDINPVYTPQGDFFVCMDIWSYWCYSSTCKWIVLSDTVPPCQADFLYTPNNSNVLGINFTDQSSNYFVTDPQGNQITLDYLWDFGDGQTATDPNPVHDYTSAGIYTVCLYINNPFTNCGDTTCYNVPVNVPTCQANFDYQISYDQSDGIYHADFNNTSYSLVTGATVTYLWDFGDGQSSVQLNPTHVYTSPGQYTACLSIFVQDNAGAIVCTDSTCYNLIISNCNANFDYVVDNNDVNFSDFSTTDTGEITTWLWNFDDGLSSFEQNPTHLYTAPGIYTVCQTITTSWGCTSTWCDDVTVTACVADFDFVTGYNPTANTYFATFTNNSTTTSGTLSYVWTFGDGTTSTQTNPTHNYANAGTYNVCLTINAFVTGTSIPICTNQVCQTVTIGSCGAAFEYVGGQFANQYVFQDFSFTDLGTVTAWAWDFGDGTTSTEQFPVHDFAPGTYTVCQTITTSWGCTSTWCDDVTVTGCVADFDYTLDVTDGYLATFTNTSTATSGTLSYVWDFGDGTTSTQANPSHVYANAGIYNVCLTINAFVIGTSIPICTNQVCQSITIGSCGAAFEYVGGQVANQYVFQDFSFTDLGTVTAWSWDFGDGTTSTEQFPVHDFALGTYTVCQTITTSWGCTSTWCDDVTVTGCIAGFDFTLDVTDGYFADFTNTSTSTSGTLSYVWDFGDGTTSTQTNPSHVFNNAGVYNVCLTINAFVTGTSIPICTNQSCQTVTVGSCSAAFEYVGGQFANQFVFQDFSFTDLGTVTAWSWDFGDGTTSTEQFPVHDFAPGTYTVCQTITTNWGCTSTWCDDITVTGCVADFDYTLDVTDGYLAIFTNNSTATSGTLSYVWDFGDGTTSTQANPSHVYTNAGIYNVCLTINAFVIGTSIPICTNQICQDITVGSCGAAFEYVGGQFANQFVFQDFSFTDLGTVTAWSWDFGDGTTATEQFPVHDFAVGTYTVCQTITTSWGCTSTWCDDVTVTGCVADFDYTLDVTDGYLAIFTNNSTATSGTLSYVWDFGDGTTSTQANPSHVYTNAGIYNVCLTINAFVIGTSIPICTNQICQPVTVGSCGAAFEYVGGQFANQYVFQDFSYTDLGTVTAWAWDFGDGTTSTEQFPVHDFAVGTYTVCQTITTSWGCTSTWCDDVTVTGCLAGFDYTLDVTDGYFANFTNTSTATDGTLSYIWTFGDGTTSTQTNPSHVFNNAGIYNVCLTINAFVIGTSIPICTNQVCQTVTIGSCGAAFEYVGGQFANQFVFQDFSFTDLGTVTAWAWDFGDGTTSTEQFPVHDFAVGTYTVCQTITTSWGCTSTWCDDVTVTGCVADFDYTLDVTDGYLAIFTNTSTTTSGTLSYVWTFGDGTTSTQTNPSHVFNNAGIYNVCLTINAFVIGTSIPICTNQVCHPITIGSCGAAFEYVGGQFANQYVFQDFSFTDLGTVTAWSWDFGDGTTSTEQFPVHDFAPGTYTVCQTITTSWGCTSTWCDDITVTGCLAGFDYTLDVTDGYFANFTNTSTATDGTLSYIWDFGDGTTSTQTNPSHVYTNAGVYNVCLTINAFVIGTSIPICTNQVCQTITIGSCGAAFEYVGGQFANQFVFQDFSFTDLGTVTAWAWDFGDGTTSTEQFPVHDFAVGTYTVCQTITTSWGCTSTWCDDITVTGCVADFDFVAGYDQIEGLYYADFTNTSTTTSGTLSYIWDFGDGTTSTQANPTHNYANAGTYNVCLTINAFVIGTSIPICTNQVCHPITIGSCGAAFEYVGGQFANQYVFQDFSFTDLGTVTSWSWDFGDGTSSTEQYPVHDFAPGTYTVCLTITTSLGCTSTSCDDITVTGCLADFDYTLDFTDGYLATFTNTSTATSGTLSYVWDFGDGTTSTQANPTHNYANAGVYNVCLTVNVSVFGIPICTNQVCQTITAASCSSYFTAAFDNGTYYFNNLSSTDFGTVTSWAWDFGDGNTSTEQYPDNTYLPGTYYPCLTITTSWGCTATYCDTIIVNACSANFDYSYNYNFATGGLTATFTSTATSSGVIDSYFWDFGDGGTSSDQNPVHDYTSTTGTYNVCLTITSGNCSDTYCQPITLGDCQADFTYTNTDPSTFNFIDLSWSLGGDIIAWNWTFGDGSTSTEQNPQHIYTGVGSYDVCLTFTTAIGCTSTACQTVSVTDCQAGFTYTLVPNDAYQADFTNTSSSSGVIDSYFWTFGDGTTSTEVNPVHFYSQAGIYTVCLTITSGNCSTISCQDITAASCSSDFTATFDNDAYYFNDLSSTDFGTVTAWAWDFGDGNTSTEQYPNNPYLPGTYYPCLTITTSWGCTATYCDTIVVNACTANFDYSYNYNFTTLGLTATFTSTATSSGVIDSYFWDFGDGGTSSAQNPVHDYTSTTGTYNVCLTITSGDCSNTVCQPITLGDCQADFTYTNTDPNTFNFVDLSWSLGGDIIAWNWTFGDGTTSTEQNPQHVYTGVGSYDVCLTFTTAIGCTSTACQTVSVTDCQANFDYSYTYNPFTVGLIGTFIANASSSGVIDSYFWDFGDGGTSSAQNPTHNYTSTTGTYNVCLTITSGNCSDTYCQPITLGDCQADFTYTNTDPSTFNFVDLSWSLGGDIIAWNWTFGDGTTSTEQNPQHIYTGVGSYDVCLTFTTAIGCTSTVCQTVTVSLTPICNADFNYQTLANGDIQFNDLSTANSTIVSWAWTFGNQTSSAQNPIQTFVGGFSYDVCLTITTSAGCTDFSCQVVFVPPTCAAFFSNQPTATNPTTIVFTDGSTSNNQITGWLWNFGDNSESEQANPIHTYQQAGTYNVCLTITTANGCNDTYCREIIVGDPCALLSADFTVTGPILFFNPFLKIFTNTSVGDIDNFVWTFGDGTSDNTNLNPTHTYTAFDTYEACLTISNNAGCTNTHCETIVVAPSAPPTQNTVTIIPNLLLADGEQIVKVIVESTQAQKCTLTSFAINGQYLKQYEVDLITGENEINLDFTYLSPAVYVVRVEIGNGLPFHEKVFKLK